MRYILTIFLIFIGHLTFGQKKYRPTIVVIDPNETHYDTTLSGAIKDYTYRVEYSPQEEKHILDSLSKSAENIQIMNVAEFHYRKDMDFASYFTLGLYGMLSYMVFGETEHCVVIPNHSKSDGAIGELEGIARKHNVQWVVNPVNLHTYKKDGQPFTVARIQVYDLNRNKIVLDKEYIGDSRNPGFELTCDDGTLDCTINNVIKPSLHDILLTILGRYQH